ncbi:MAG TPA: hypothetical protein VFT74_16040 [Isosphaeraceae bacterium]|nr:hypothetical protein [Isosphaeraceae bacterium]
MPILTTDSFETTCMALPASGMDVPGAGKPAQENPRQRTELMWDRWEELIAVLEPGQSAAPAVEDRPTAPLVDRHPDEDEDADEEFADEDDDLDDEDDEFDDEDFDDEDDEFDDEEDDEEDLDDEDIDDIDIDDDEDYDEDDDLDDLDEDEEDEDLDEI